MADPQPRVSSIGAAPPHLTGDLQHAFAAADYLVSKVEALICLLLDPTLADGNRQDQNFPNMAAMAVRDLVALEKNERRAAAAIRRVSNEITAVNRGPVRLPVMDDEWLLQPNAHQAVVSITACFLETVLDSIMPPFQIFQVSHELRPLRQRRRAIRRSFPEIARQLASLTWPDWTTLQETILVEAATAAHARRSLRGPALWPASPGPAPTDSAAAPAAGADSAAARSDGPVPPHWLRWHGELIRIGSSRAQLSWRLLAYFWARPSATFDELHGAGQPWPDPASESAIASAVNRFNNAVPADFPWRLATKAYCVVKEFRENPLV